VIAAQRGRAYGERARDQEATMRKLLPLLLAAPLAVWAQGPGTIPRTAIPQTAVPGAGPIAPGTPGVAVVAPIQGGGAAIVAPGAPLGPGPAYVVPNDAGGTTIIAPGQGTTIIRRNPAGGTTIVGPQGTTLVNPIPGSRGGATITGPGPGMPGYIVPTPQGTYVQPQGDAGSSVILYR
jgi:hypothetical protein